jgi:hypothetical protein
MLLCKREARSFQVVAQWPPEHAPAAARLAPGWVSATVDLPTTAPIDFSEHHTPADGQVDVVADRLEQREARREEETAEQKKRRKLEISHERALSHALEAAHFNQRPNLAEVDDYDAIAIVDPNEAEELVLVGKGPPMRIKPVRPKMRMRVVALRDDPIGRLAKRRMLGEGDDRDDRLRAARIWQAYYERAEIGGARGIDPSRDVVDGGGFVMPDTDQRLRAQEKLHKVREALGFINELRILGSRLLTWVLGEKKSLTEVAEILGIELKLAGREKSHLSLAAHLRNCLDIIAVELDVTTDPDRVGPRRRQRDRYDLEAQPLDRHAHNTVLAAAVRRANKLRESECTEGGLTAGVIVRQKLS